MSGWTDKLAAARTVPDWMSGYVEVTRERYDAMVAVIQAADSAVTSKGFVWPEFFALTDALARLREQVEKQ